MSTEANNATAPEAAPDLTPSANWGAKPDPLVKPGLSQPNKRRLSYLAIGTGWLAEVLATLAVTGPVIDSGGPLVMLAWHLVACTITTLGLCLFVSTQTELMTQARRVAPLFFSLCLLIPFAVVALALATLFGFLNPRVKKVEPLRLVPIPSLPFKPLEVDTGLAFANGGLFDVLRHSADVDKRRTAVMATTRMRDNVAVPLLKLAMRDPVDDVRLLAYSIKDKIESRINHTIREEQEKLANHKGEDPADIHRVLAFSYWEMVYLDLVEGDLRNFIIGQAIEHANLCLASKADGAVNTLIGRAELARGNYTEALAALHTAVANGSRPATVASYLAEIYYQRGDFMAVPAALTLIPKQFKSIPAVRRVCTKWAVS